MRCQLLQLYRTRGQYATGAAGRGQAVRLPMDASIGCSTCSTSSAMNAWRSVSCVSTNVPLSGLYEIAGEVPAPERLVPTFRNSPRTVWPLVRLTGPEIATKWSLRVE